MAHLEDMHICLLVVTFTFQVNSRECLSSVTIWIGRGGHTCLALLTRVTCFVCYLALVEHSRYSSTFGGVCPTIALALSAMEEDLHETFFLCIDDTSRDSKSNATLSRGVAVYR